MAVRDFGHALRLFLLLPLARLDILDPHIMGAQEFFVFRFFAQEVVSDLRRRLERFFYKVDMLDPRFKFAQEVS